jgi:uncharacterized protein (TIGR01619 family)
MAEDWNSYIAKVNDNVASIFLDLSLRSEIPDQRRPWLLWVWVKLKSPRPDGLSDRSELDSLIALETRLAQALSQKCNVVFAGTITSQGRREYYFYGGDPEKLESAVDETKRVFRAYEFDWGSKLDPDWRQYLDVLFPCDEDMERIKNRKVLAVLQREGDALTASREVTHWAYFKHNEGRDGFKNAVQSLGYRIGSESEDLKYEFPKGICFARFQSVNQSELDEAVLELFRIAKKFQGSYDGWETQVV